MIIIFVDTKINIIKKTGFFFFFGRIAAQYQPFNSLVRFTQKLY